MDLDYEPNADESHVKVCSTDTNFVCSKDFQCSLPTVLSSCVCPSSSGLISTLLVLSPIISLSFSILTSMIPLEQNDSTPVAVPQSEYVAPLSEKSGDELLWTAHDTAPSRNPVLESSELAYRVNHSSMFRL